METEVSELLHLTICNLYSRVFQMNVTIVRENYSRYSKADFRMMRPFSLGDLLPVTSVYSRLEVRVDDVHCTLIVSRVDSTNFGSQDPKASKHGPSRKLRIP